MKLIGELNRSFGNFLTLRGIAKMDDLERISKPDPSYQRDLYKTHGKKMVEFLKNGEYTFYPELILSVTLDKKGDIQDMVKELYESVPHKTFKKITFSNFRLKGMTRKIKSQNDLRITDHHCTGIFETDGDDKKILNRIDGNHRLDATEKSGKGDMLVPFCIIFFRNDAEAQKSDRILFTNINYKHLSLTPEENLRLILDKQENDNYLYEDHELRTNKIWFGPHFYLARKAFEKLSLDNLVKIKGILCTGNIHKYTRTLLVELFELLLGEKKINGRCSRKKDEKIKKAFREVEKCYDNYAPGTLSQNYQLLLTHFYFYYDNKLLVFSNWVRKNHIYELQSTKPEGLIALFNKIFESKKRTIFLAMDFGENANQNYDAIKGAVDDVNQECAEDLKLGLIRIDKNDKGYSYAITDEIFEQIENGGYLIADLSLGNKNVYHEIGYQMGLNKGKELQQNNFLLVHNKKVSKANFEKDIGFNISNISVVKANDSNDLREKVKSSLKKYYGFSNLTSKEDV